MRVFWKELTFGFLIILAPLLWQGSLNDIFLEFILKVMVITDLVDYSVFLLFPLLLFAKSASILFLEGKFLALAHLGAKTLLFFAVCFFLYSFLFYCFRKEPFGWGDVYVYASLLSYFDGFFLLCSLFLASLLAVIFFIGNYFFSYFYLQIIKNEEIPFLPFLYIALFLLCNKKIFFLFSNLLVI